MSSSRGASSALTRTQVGRAAELPGVVPIDPADGLRRQLTVMFVDLVGSTGSLDFDPATGEAPTDDVILCLKNERGQTAAVESGLVYRAGAKKLEGQLRCN